MNDPVTRPPVVRGRPPKDVNAPRGREQVVAATIEAAAELFSERGIATVSVREVASHAGVNPALVHRYVGGKTELVRAAIDHLVEDMRGYLRTAASSPLPALPGAPEQTMATYQRIVAHIVIEGGDIREYQSEFPVIHHVIDEIERRSGVDPRTARMRAAQLFALDLAVRLFEPVLVRAAGLEPDDTEDLHQRVRELLMALAEEP